MQLDNPCYAVYYKERQPTYMHTYTGEERSGEISHSALFGGVTGVAVIVTLSIVAFVMICTFVRSKKHICHRNSRTGRVISSPISDPPVTAPVRSTGTTSAAHRETHSPSTRPQQRRNSVPIRTRHLNFLTVMTESVTIEPPANHYDDHSYSMQAHQPHNTSQVQGSHVNFQPAMAESVITTETTTNGLSQPQQSPPEACLTPSDPNLTQQPPPSYSAAVTYQTYASEKKLDQPQSDPYPPPPDYQVYKS